MDTNTNITCAGSIFHANWNTFICIGAVIMNFLNKDIDINELEQHQPEALRQLKKGLQPECSQDGKSVVPWTQEFAASGKVGKR
ncbi:MAG: hypothetical protein HY356_01555 [Gammaproteobacteria bacterium]|nr:hypothetical protein [Gammaproteobacteria bacterium]